MKTIKKISAIVVLLSGIMLTTSTVFSQSCINTVGSFPTPARYEVQAPVTNFLCITAGTGLCSTGGGAGTLNLKGMGVNQNNPQWMLDILCDPTTTPATNMDVNIACPNCAYSDAVGFRVGGNMFLWHAGDVSSYYSGVNAGYILSSSPNFNFNTLIGYEAGQNLSYPGMFNTAIGSQAAQNLSTGASNTIIGSSAGLTLSTGANNTLIGYNAGQQIGIYSWNTMVGWNCGVHTTADENSFYGKACGFHNTDGTSNCFYGAHSSDGNVHGSQSVTMGVSSESSNQYNINNVVLGFEADFYGGYINTNASDNNVIMGDEANYWGGYTSPSTDNVVIGYKANYIGSYGGISQYNVLLGDNCSLGNTTGTGLGGSYDVLLGSQSYMPGGSSNSVAIGANTECDNSNEVILGNNSQYVGIGMSGVVSALTNKLVISYYHAISPYPTGSPFPFYSSFSGIVGSSLYPTGASGVQLRDLTTASYQYPYVTGQGFLTVDDGGNMVYMAAPTGGGGGGGIGYCSPGPGLTAMTGSGGYDLNGYNLNFAGYGSHSLSNNCVVIGKSCATPVAKLDVLQNSLTSHSTQSSIGINVENDDLENVSGNTLQTYPVIGIKSYVPNPSQNCQAVAGWFQADYSSCFPSTALYANAPNNNALIVPNSGGSVGFGTSLVQSSTMLTVDGDIYDSGSVTITVPASVSATTTALTLNNNANTGATVMGANITASGATGSGATNPTTIGANITTYSATATGYGNATNIGVNITTYSATAAYGGAQTIGAYINVTGATGGAAATNSGIVAIATTPQTYGTTYRNFGGSFWASGAGGGYPSTPWGYNYGIWAGVPVGADPLADPAYYNNCAGVFQGDVYTWGGLHSLGGYISGSDSAIKQNVHSFTNALSIIHKLSPKTYHFNPNNRYQIRLDTFQHYGFIAQEVGRVVPCISRTVPTPPVFDSARNVIVPTSTVNGLDYDQFIPILTAAVQQEDSTVTSIKHTDSIIQTTQQHTIDSLRTRLTNIENCLSELCGNSGGDHSSIHHNSGGNNEGDQSPANVQDVSLSSSNAPLLYQNTPNPFSTGTKINYYLPEGTMGATIVFIDSYGNQLKVVTLPQTGNGTLNVAPDNLAAGIYSYSLVVNGKVIDTKRMILQK